MDNCITRHFLQFGFSIDMGKLIGLSIDNFPTAKFRSNCQIALQQPEIASIVVKLQPWFPEVFKMKRKIKSLGKHKAPQVS